MTQVAHDQPPVCIITVGAVYRIELT